MRATLVLVMAAAAVLVGCQAPGGSGPRDELTPLQVKMMSTQPDMILAFAHHVAEDFSRRGIEGVEVRADAWASLNGRRSQRLVDPEIDLAREVDDLRPKPWIVPFVEGRVP